MAADTMLIADALDGLTRDNDLNMVCALECCAARGFKHRGGAYAPIPESDGLSPEDYRRTEHIMSRLRRPAYMLTPMARSEVAAMFKRASLGWPKDDGTGERAARVAAGG